MRPRSSNEGPLTAAPDGVRVPIRLTPRSRADHIDGVTHFAAGSTVLKVSVTAPPIENRANDALIAVLREGMAIAVLPTA